MDNAPLAIDDRLDQLFDQLRHATEYRPSTLKKVALISTPRCGSKYFCESLASTEKFGRPAKWMNLSYINAYIRVVKPENSSLSEYLDFVIGRTTTPNGIFSLNFHVDQFMYWQSQGVDLMTIQFDRIYHLRRRNKLAQALSYAKALESGQWRATDKPERDVSIDQITNPMVMAALHKLSLMDEFHERHLEKFVHKSFSYENYSTDASCFHDVLQDCGVEHQDITNFGCAMKIQRGGHDRAALSRLEEYLGCKGSAT